MLLGYISVEGENTHSTTLHNGASGSVFGKSLL